MTEEISPRIIKKYPNRRLYDMAISSYITLDDVRALVIEQIPFQVIDARSGSDITNNTMLQIISEQEDRTKESPIFTNRVLQNIIRFHDNPLRYLLSRYLDQSMLFFINHQETLAEDVKMLLVSRETPVLQEIAERNLAMWLSLQREDIQKALEKELQSANPTIASKTQDDPSL